MMDDDKFYKKVVDELNGKPRKYTDKALMAKAEVLTEGDSEKTRYKYIQLRVEQLKEKEHRKIEQEKIEQEKIEQEKFDEINSKKTATSMLERFALVIHWTFFLIGLLSFFYLINLNVYENIIRNLLLSGIPLFGWTLSGWAVRFVLVDKIPFFPFIKKGDTGREPYKRFGD